MRRTMTSMAQIFPPEALLADFAPPTVALAEELRTIVQAAIPGVVERVRPGWRLIGYDAPVRRGTRYVAWIFPERVHVHLGFVQGVLIHDPGARLEGRGETKNARWFTWRPGEAIDADEVRAYLREAVRVTTLPREERFALAMAMAEPGERPA
jgi:hypothetical protein